MPAVYNYYEGTQLTGTSKDAKKFSNLSNYYHGVKVHYVRGDRYYNTKTGHVYICRQGAAEAKDSMWAYSSTEILSTPGKLATISISKSNDTSLTFTGKFKWIASDYESTSTHRAQEILVRFMYKTTKGKVYVVAAKELTPSSVKSFTEWSVSLKSTIKMMYPLQDEPLGYPGRAHSVYFDVRGSNVKGRATGNKSSSYTFSKPRVPKISDMAYNASNGEISCVVTADEGKDSHQHVDMIVKVVKVNAAKSPKTVSEGDSKTTALTTTKKYDITNVASITGKHYAAMSVRAKARGIAGDSDWTDKYVLYVSKPQNVVIKKGTRYESDGTTVVPINIKPQDAQHPVTGVRMQVLRSCQYSKESDIPLNANWTNVGGVDDGQCSWLACETAELVPDVDTHSWIRIKAWNLDEDSLHTYSSPIRLKSLETVSPTAADDVCRILKVETGDDGESVFVTVVWKSDDSNNTEVSWSNNENAWTSTQQPSTFVMDDATWGKNKQNVIDSVTYTRTATLNVVGLNSDDTWYFSARRIRDVDGETVTKGKYCRKEQIVPSRAPSDVSMYVPEYIISGKSLTVSWDFDGIDRQTGWKVRTCSNNGPSASDPIIMNGSGLTSACSLPWSKLKSRVIPGGSSKPVGNTVEGVVNLYVDVTTKAGTASSAWKEVAVVGKPKISIPTMPKVPSQPAMITVQSSTNNTSLSIIIRSQGASQDAPDGYRTQARGDVVWSDLVSPNWVPAQSYSPQSEIAEAKANLDNKQSAYNAADAAYSALEQAYVTAWVTYNNAASEVVDLTEALVPANQSLSEAQSYLNTLQEGDDGYAEAVEAVSEASAYVNEIETQLGTEQSPGPAVIAESNALSAMESARSAYESYDMSTVTEQLEQARIAYYTAEATHIQTVSADKPYATTITIPADLDLIDGARYAVDVVAIEGTVGVRSDTATGRFSVDLTHKAPQPPENVSVEPVDVTDDSGYRTIGALITLADSVRTVSSDRYEVYRVSQDGSVLVAGGLTEDSTVLDSYAPFGDAYLRYRVACRTDDGDVAWRDYDYYLLGDLKPGTGFMRIDWASEYVELEHSVASSDSYQKGFEARKHLDGTISGHWDEGVQRTASLSATAMRGFESATIEALRRLAHHSGPCIVRTTDGTAYEADVEVDGISPSSGTVNVGISMSATEVNLTDEFMATEVPSA